jgi:hypothetical protein
MKEVSLLFLFLLALASCERGVVLQEPTGPQDLDLDLGNFPAQPASLAFTPYEQVSELVFVDARGQEYSFKMIQEIRREGYRYTDTYPHPTEANQRVNYQYTGSYYEYEFSSAELGARLEVILRPALCNDPRLATEDRVLDHLQIFGVGFNPLDVYNEIPTLDIEIPTRGLCSAERRKYGELTLLGRTFSEVYYSQLFWQGRPLAFYYTPTQGIVAFETSYLLAVLDRSF